MSKLFLSMKSAGPVAIGAVLLGLTGCSTAKVASRTNLTAAPSAPPACIYVSDFDLEIDHIKADKGLLPSLTGREGPLTQILEGHAADPAALGTELVDLMADSIVHDLTKAGLRAVRIAPGSAVPASGWMLRGVFTEVQEGNRVRRAVIGLGFGKTDLEVVTTTDDLSVGAPKPFYRMEVDAASSKRPGGAATVVLSPFAIPVHFVLAGGDLKKNVKHTAAKIADEVTQRVRKANGQLSAGHSPGPVPLAQHGI